MTKNDERKSTFKRLSLKHKNLIDLVVDGATYTEASMSVCPEHAGWSSKAHSAYVSRILMSDLGQQYYQERLLEIEKNKEKALRERYQNPMWSFEDSVQHLRLVIQMAKEELATNRETFKRLKKGHILTPTCVNAMLNSIAMLNRLYRYDSADQSSLNETKLSLEKELLALKAEKEKLQLEKELIMLDREKGEICYNDVAVSEFSKVIKVVYDSVVRIPATLSSENDFTIEQKATIMKVIESILESLSNVRVELSSANTIDKKLSEMSSHSSKASKKKQVQK